jgi:hypothetical protein
MSLAHNPYFDRKATLKILSAGAGLQTAKQRLRIVLMPIILSAGAGLQPAPSAGAGLQTAKQRFLSAGAGLQPAPQRLRIVLMPITLPEQVCNLLRNV